MDYLLDVYIFSPEDIELNKKVLTWPRNMNPIYDQNDEVPIRCFLAVIRYRFSALNNFRSVLFQ